MAERLAALQAIHTAVWRELASATQDKQHPWRTPVLATTDGHVADARTVILREVDERQQQLMTFTDDRAGQVAQLLGHPLGTMVMWSPALSWQLRCRVLLSQEMSGLAATSRWAKIKLTPAAQDYLALLPPGAPLATAQHAAATDQPPPARHAYFAVITAQVMSIDWLELHRDGHRRVRFDDQGARWIQP
jgi:pyridoxamine 5'-phosphate oxidase